MASPNLEIFIGLRDIAELANVRPSAVSNWRKRHEDFPTPRVKAAGGALFDLHEVEAWLLANGKIDRPVSPQDVVWRVIDALRGEWQPEQVSNFVMSALVFLAGSRQVSSSLDRPIAPWSVWRDVPDDQLLDSLRSAASTVEERRRDLEGLILPGLDEEPSPDPRVVRAIFAALENAVIKAGDAFFRETVERVFAFDRFDAAMLTPPALADLMTRAVEPLGDTVVDPACGIGGLLLEAAYRADALDGRDRRLVGYDIDHEAIRYARAWLTVFGETAEFHLADSLKLTGSPSADQELATADTVLVDPPLALKNWGDAEVYADEGWPYGAPPPSSGDLAWPQVAIKVLRTGGRAAVVLPPGATSRTGREAAIRQRMLEDGIIEAVIQLPPRIRRNTSIPLTVWLLEATDRSRNEILLIDATSLGTPGRTEHDFDPSAVTRVLETLAAWRTDRRVDDGTIAAAVSLEALEGSVISPPRYVGGPPDIDPTALRAELEVLRADETRVVIDIPRGLSPPDRSTGERARLGDLVELHRGTQSAETRGSNGDVLLIQPANVVDPRRPLETVMADVAGQQPSVRAGDIIVALQHAGAPIVQVPPEWDGAVLDRRCATMRIRAADAVIPEWLALWARSSNYDHQVAARSAGTTVARVSSRELLEVSVPLPDLETQRRIADELADLDAAVQRLEDTAERLRRRRDLEAELVLHDLSPRNGD